MSDGFLLDDRLRLRLAEAHIATLPDEPGRPAGAVGENWSKLLDQVVEQRYTGLVDVWERTIVQVRKG